MSDKVNELVEKCLLIVPKWGVSQPDILCRKQLIHAFPIIRKELLTEEGVKASIDSILKRERKAVAEESEARLELIRRLTARCEELIEAKKAVAEEIKRELEKYGVWFEHFDKRNEYQGNYVRISEAVWLAVFGNPTGKGEG